MLTIALVGSSFAEADADQTNVSNTKKKPPPVKKMAPTSGVARFAYSEIGGGDMLSIFLDSWRLASLTCTAAILRA